MEKGNLPQWLRTWQSEFQTCLDVWTELKEEALAHQLSEFFNEDGKYVVKKDGKWGIVNRQQKILLPFEYDFIFRKPDSIHYYVLIKDGKQGLATLRTRRGEVIIDIVISVEMDAIHHVPGWDLTLFTKNGKWGWWWEDTFDFYKNYSDPEYDSIYVQPIEEVWEMPDDEDEIITVRKGDKFYDILYWTSK